MKETGYLNFRQGLAYEVNSEEPYTGLFQYDYLNDDDEEYLKVPFGMVSIPLTPPLEEYYILKGFSLIWCDDARYDELQTNNGYSIVKSAYYKNGVLEQVNINNINVGKLEYIFINWLQNNERNYTAFILKDLFTNKFKCIGDDDDSEEEVLEKLKKEDVNFHELIEYYGSCKECQNNKYEYWVDDLFPFFDNMCIDISVEFSQGVPHGKTYIKEYRSGQNILECQFKKGKKHGKFIERRLEDGGKNKEVTFVDGKLVNECWFINDIKTKEIDRIKNVIYNYINGNKGLGVDLSTYREKLYNAEKEKRIAEEKDLKAKAEAEKKRKKVELAEAKRKKAELAEAKRKKAELAEAKRKIEEASSWLFVLFVLAFLILTLSLI